MKLRHLAGKGDSVSDRVDTSEHVLHFSRWISAKKVGPVFSDKNPCEIRHARGAQCSDHFNGKHRKVSNTWICQNAF